MLASRGRRLQLQRICSRRPVGVASPHERLLMVTLRAAKRLQRIVACHICNVAGCLCRNQSIRLRERCKILREQAWQCHAGNGKWPDNFRALRKRWVSEQTMADL